MVLSPNPYFSLNTASKIGLEKLATEHGSTMGSSEGASVGYSAGVSVGFTVGSSDALISWSGDFVDFSSAALPAQPPSMVIAITAVSTKEINNFAFFTVFLLMSI